MLIDGDGHKVVLFSFTTVVGNNVPTVHWFVRGVRRVWLMRRRDLVRITDFKYKLK